MAARRCDYKAPRYNLAITLHINYDLAFVRSITIWPLFVVCLDNGVNMAVTFFTESIINRKDPSKYYSIRVIRKEKPSEV